MKLFVCLLALPLAAAQMSPFEMIWRADGPVAADVSFLLDRPAGKGGFVAIRDGHLVKPDGKRLRLWGVNFSMAANAPRKEDAPYIAAHLARLGVNCVRIHHFDHPAPRGVLAADRQDTRALDAGVLDRFDYLVAELKKRGIYTNINLNVARLYKPGDGVREFEPLGYGKAATLFDERLIELQQEYARMLLTHRNPYTNSEYRNEPAVVTVEIVNENSVIESWKAGRLEGKGKQKGQEITWVDIPPSYEQELTRMFHQWLAKRKVEGGGQVARLKPAEFRQASEARFRTEAAFYMDLEDRFYQRMYKFLKNDLGVKAPIIGTSVHNGGISAYPLLPALAKLDIVDTHTYWQHPRYSNDPATGKRLFEIQNTPMVNAPDRSSIVTLSRAAVAGKPFTVSEVNHPYPSEYAAEGIPILAAYAAFHDWDGIYWYTLEHSGSAEWTPRAPGHFDLRQDPVKMTQLAAGAMMFLRADVSPAKQTVFRSYTRDQIYESLRMPSSEAPYFTPGLSRLTPLVHATRIVSLDKPQEGSFPAIAGPSVTSDTGEIEWLAPVGGKGLVAVRTERTEALIGYLKANRRTLRTLAADVENEFCVLSLSSMDSKPLSGSASMLLTTGARAGATGMQWNEKRTTTTELGGAPVVMEAVTGTVTLSNLKSASAVDVQALDGAGKPAGKPIAAERAGGSWRFRVGQTTTPWYQVRVTR